MKVLIWILCIVVGVTLNEILGYLVGFKLGYVLLTVLIAAVAKALCGKVGGKKKAEEKPKAPQTPKAPPAAPKAAPPANVPPAPPAPPAAPVSPAPSAGSWVCPQCGSVHSIDSRFCTRCGTAQNSPSHPPKPPVAEPIMKTTPVMPQTVPCLTLHLSSLGTDVSMEKTSFTAGREPQCDLSLVRLPNAQYIARKQASFTYSAGTWYIRDEGSTNGTWLNNQRLTAQQPYRLSCGDVISFAGKETLTVRQLTR